MAAVTVLMLMPGPNVALIIANSVAHGPRYGMLTVAGTSSAMVVQLALAALGVTELRAPQVALLSATFLVIAILVDGGWALLAARARSLLRANGKLRNRLAGGFLTGAGAALAMVRTK